MLTLNEQEEKVIEKIVSAIADYIQIEPMQITPLFMLSFPKLEIRHHQRRVLRGGEEINLTCLEYSILVLLASNPHIILTRIQIFEAVWNMDNDSCQSSISTVICNLRKKIEPDRKNSTYIKIVLGINYKFNREMLGDNFLSLSFSGNLLLLQRSLYLLFLPFQIILFFAQIIAFFAELFHVLNYACTPSRQSGSIFLILLFSFICSERHIQSIRFCTSLSVS